MPDRTVVAFDLDGTLTRRDTLLPFLRRACGGTRTSRAVLAQSLLVLRYLGGGGVRDRLKVGLLGQLLRGLELAALEESAEAFADLVTGSRLRPLVRERLDWHRDQGHELVIVSASPELYVAPIGRRLGFGAVLGTRLECDADGRLTGRLVGRNCRGREKVARLREWLGPEAAFLYAYGDSAGDKELLEAADVGVRVVRGRLPPVATRDAAAP
ncbi:MAG TPA: HAD-IB family hydrolase [Acidimicrobiales bacterium]|nr:HAD-IB family hydrolase [Acidimicrobiales bacterium]